MSEVVVLKAYRANKVLPPGYSVDHDPDICILRRPDGSVAAYFSIWSIDLAHIRQEAEADLLRQWLADR
jgi:hypothetical protein